MKRTILTLMSIALLAHFTNGSVDVGSEVPNFNGTDDTGETVQLSETRGQYVVLEWLNHGCPFVRKHYKSGAMQTLQEKLTDAGVVWWSVVSSAEGRQGYMTPEESVKKRAKVDSHASRVILDPSGEIGELFGAKVTPHMYLIAPNGELVYKGAIDSISSTNPDDLEKAENYVLSAWENHKAGEPVDPRSTRAYGCRVKYGY